jgi:hypothetical protein
VIGSNSAPSNSSVFGNNGEPPFDQEGEVYVETNARHDGPSHHQEGRGNKPKDQILSSAVQGPKYLLEIYFVGQY